MGNGTYSPTPMSEYRTSDAYVLVDIAEQHIEPSEESEVVNRLSLGERVDVFEESNGWSRVTWYYDHFFDGSKYARWMKTSFLGSEKPPSPEHELPDTRLGKALANSDEVRIYWRRFLQGAKRAIERGLVSEDDFVEWGGWVRSASVEGFYFINPELHVTARIYLHAPTGRMAQWQPWMGDKEIAQHLYERQNGKCVLCREQFRLRNLEKDHIIPRRKRRIDRISNLQLLCSACNRVKGDRSQELAIGRLRELGVVEN